MCFNLHLETIFMYTYTNENELKQNPLFIVFAALDFKTTIKQQQHTKLGLKLVHLF